jgi:biotin operon repressor
VPIQPLVCFFPPGVFERTAHARRVSATVNERGFSEHQYVYASDWEPHERVNHLVALGVQAVVCGGIDVRSAEWLHSVGVKVFARKADLRNQLREADLVIPSLDAGYEALFQAVNRPHEAIAFDRMLDGLIAFRQEFKGAYWLEVMVVGGYTGTVEQIGRLADCVRRIQPDRIQLNTVTRPPAEQEAAAVSPERLKYFCTLFQPEAEVIADFRAVHQQAQFVTSRNEVLTLLQRRPCSLADIAAGLGMHENEVVKYLEELRVSGAIEPVTTADKQFYRAIQQA